MNLAKQISSACIAAIVDRIDRTFIVDLGLLMRSRAEINTAMLDTVI